METDSCSCEGGFLQLLEQIIAAMPGDCIVLSPAAALASRLLQKRRSGSKEFATAYASHRETRTFATPDMAVRRQVTDSLRYLQLSATHAGQPVG